MAGNRPTHFSGGVSVSAVSTPLYLMPFLDPTKYNVWFSDFNEFVTGNWISNSTTTTVTRAVAGADGGILAFTTPALDDCLINSQWGGGNNADVAETFKWESTKKLFIYAKLKVSDATDTDMIVGLSVADTTPLDTTDGIYFSLTDQSAALSAVVRGSSTSSTQALGNLVDDTYATMAISYIPGTGFECYLNEALVGVLPTTNAPTTELAVTLAIQSGAAAITTGSFDYLLVAKER